MSIYIEISKTGNAILKYPEHGIETKAYIGQNGITKNKKEGDGKTPIGEFELGIMLGMHSINKLKNKSKPQYIQINKNMYWVDDPKSKYYNKLVDILKVKKDWNSAEHLINYPIQYEYLIEIKINPNNIPGKGSATFLHCTNNKPTKGCIAIDRKNMKSIIKNVDMYTKINIYKR